MAGESAFVITVPVGVIANLFAWWTLADILRKLVHHQQIREDGVVVASVFLLHDK